jgi:hypothetical protein
MGNRPPDGVVGGPVGASSAGEAKLRVYIMTENAGGLEKMLKESTGVLQKRFSSASPASGLTPLELAVSHGLKIVRTLFS